MPVTGKQEITSLPLSSHSACAAGISSASAMICRGSTILRRLCVGVGPGVAVADGQILSR